MQLSCKNKYPKIFGWYWLEIVSLIYKLKQITMTTIRTYRGIEVTQSYCPSNFGGTNDFFCIINGKVYRSPSWDNLKKTIRNKS